MSAYDNDPRVRREGYDNYVVTVTDRDDDYEQWVTKEPGCGWTNGETGFVTFYPGVDEAIAALIGPPQ